MSAPQQHPPSTLTEDARIFEYSRVAAPISSGAMPKIPIRVFSPYLYESGRTRVVPLDLSSELKTTYDATSPSLLSSFIRIQAGQKIATTLRASSEVYFVIRGAGHSDTPFGSISWNEGDVLVLPGISAAHCAERDSTLFTVSDAPLLQYLCVEKFIDRFAPTLYGANLIRKKLKEAKSAPEDFGRNRTSIVLANRRFDQALTMPHTLWCSFASIASGVHQLPQRHQSVTLDFVVDAKPGVYTLLGSELNEDGAIRDPVRVDWVRGAAFVIPPGYWHEHVNESGENAIVMPVEDAGLYAYLRTLGNRFYRDD